jgi:hypothetical protein
MHVLPCRK